ncbi:MAG: hypothetical protein RBS31_02750 [Candidatus Syntrophosphaera sp.]|nr:hypothetical protein [Candidatus Syntrophosphaera sp.]
MFQPAHSLLPTSTQTRSAPVILSASDGLAGAPDSSGRRCQIHLAQCGKPATLFHRINPARQPVKTGVPTGS